MQFTKRRIIVEFHNLDTFFCGKTNFPFLFYSPLGATSKAQIFMKGHGCNTSCLYEPIVDLATQSKENHDHYRCLCTISSGLLFSTGMCFLVDAMFGFPGHLLASPETRSIGQYIFHLTKQVTKTRTLACVGTKKFTLAKKTLGVQMSRQIGIPNKNWKQKEI